MGNCNINRCCKDFAEFIKIEENEDLKIIQPNSIKKGAYNDKILSKKIPWNFKWNKRKSF